MQKTFTGYLGPGVDPEDVISFGCVQMGCANTVEVIHAEEDAFPMLTDLNDLAAMHVGEATKVKIIVKTEQVSV
jgi:hypothetical protein